jgi:hypothetical protein
MSKRIDGDLDDLKKRIETNDKNLKEFLSKVKSLAGASRPVRRSQSSKKPGTKSERSYGESLASRLTIPGAILKEIAQNPLLLRNAW